MPNRAVSQQEKDSNTILELQAKNRLLEAEKYRGFQKAAESKQVQQCYEAVRSLGKQLDDWTKLWAKAVHQRNWWKRWCAAWWGIALVEFLFIGVLIYKMRHP